MGHVSLKPPQPAEPDDAEEIDLAGPPWVIDAAREGWADSALDLLLDCELIRINGVLIDGARLDPGRTVWSQLRRILRANGIRCPRMPP